MRQRTDREGASQLGLTGTASQPLRLAEQAAEQAVLFTVAEVGSLLRTTRTGIYAMVARQQLPGVTRLGRRVLFNRRALLDWLEQKGAPSPGE